MQIKPRQTAKSQNTNEQRPLLFVLRFIALWLGSLIVVAAITLLSDINWSRPYLEKQLDCALNRTTRLGRLKWCIGLNGLAIWTNKLTILDRNGEPFVNATKSEMGVSVFSLFRGRPVITFLSFDQARVQFKKLGPNRWNIDDLLKPGPDIRFLQLSGSEIDFIDKRNSEARLEPISLKKVELKLNFPHRNATKPFFLSFVLPEKNQQSRFSLEGLGKGELEQWKNNHYSFKLTGEKLEAKTLDRLIAYLNPAAGARVLLAGLNGLIDLKVSGNGALSEAIDTTIAVSSPELIVDSKKLGRMEAGKTSLAMHAAVSEGKLEWKDALFNMKGLDFHSSGQLIGWLEQKPAIAADLIADVDDVGALQDLFSGNAGAGKKGSAFVLGDIGMTRLVGKAQIQIKLTGSTDDTKIATYLKTRDLAIKEILAKAHSRFPLLCMVGIHPRAKIKSDIHIDHDGTIELSDTQITGPGTNLTASGSFDPQRNLLKLMVHGNKISLKQSGITLIENDSAYKQVTGSIKLPGKASFIIDGDASADATIESTSDRFAINGKLALSNAAFELKNKLLKVSQVKGSLLLSDTTSGGTIKFEGMKGKIGDDGNFELDGRLSLTRTPEVDLVLHAKSFDLKHLSSLLSLVQINVPVITERQLYGRVEDVILKVTGTPDAPHIYFSAVPDDLYYKPPGLAKPLRAAAGLITYDNDNLTLKEVSLLSRGKTIITSLTIERVTRECTLKRVKAKSDNFDLSDIDYYLSSTAMPPPLRKAYLDFLKQYKLSNLKGRAYGDILCLINGADVKFDGIIGCYKAAATAMGYPLTGIEGIFAASGEELMLQDVICRLRSSKFTLNGYISNYRSQYPTWQTEISSTLAAQELIELIPDLMKQNNAKIEITSKGPLSLRAKVNGNLDFNQVQYSLIANKKDAIKIATPFGNLFQPTDTPVTIDGVISIKKKSVQLGDTHLLIGDSLIRIDGQITKDQDRPANIDLTCRIDQHAAIDQLMAVLYPPFSANVQGKIGGMFALSGSLNDPLVTTDISLSDVSMPKFAISHLDGSIKGGAQIEKLGQRRSIKAKPSVIQIDSLVVRKLPIKNIQANISLASAIEQTNDAAKSRSAIAVNNGVASLASGTVTFSARIYPDESRISMAINGKSISAAEIGDKLMGHPGEISGKADSAIQVETFGSDYRGIIKNMRGSGKIVVREGVINRIGHLQTRITQYNLLTQGIFGFNVNNLVQSVWPTRTGQFHNLTYGFTIADGNLKLDEIRLSGDDLRLWGTGQADLLNDQVDLQIAGKIPRVATSRLGTLGVLAGNFTIQKLMRVATFGKLENLPSFPLLGDIASDKPRAFIFNVDCPANDAKLIAKSIEKSFKWIPDKPEASAHPVPGIQHQI